MIQDYLISINEILEKKGLRYYNKLITSISNDIKECFNDKKVVLIMGNGGSAADAQHWAGELNCSYKKKSRPPIAAIAITTDTSTITACANDFGYENIFSRQVESYKSIAGLVIGLTTSGKSLNIVKALNKANELKIKSIAISGNKISDAKYTNFYLESNDTPIVQTIMQIIYHEVCNKLEDIS